MRIPLAALLAMGMSVGCERSSSNAEADVAAPPPVMVTLGPGEVDVLVRAHLAEWTGPVVVYVGATWCEPCAYFKDALGSGALDSRFAGLRILELDFDQDEERLAAAGYDGEYLPRFVRPRTDGRGSEQRFEGSVKGAAAVANITPRLEALVRGPSAAKKPLP